MIANLGPGAQSAYNRLIDSCADLETARRRVESTAVASGMGNRVVTAELLTRLAASSRASPELRSYASRVVVGECAWNSIELATPIPPEVHELKADPRAEWPRDWPPEDDRPFSIQWQ